MQFYSAVLIMSGEVELCLYLNFSRGCLCEATGYFLLSMHCVLRDGSLISGVCATEKYIIFYLTCKSEFGA